jgi:hypothetical protein
MQLHVKHRVYYPGCHCCRTLSPRTGLEGTMDDSLVPSVAASDGPFMAVEGRCLGESAIEARAPGQSGQHSPLNLHRFCEIAGYL